MTKLYRQIFHSLMFSRNTGVNCLVFVSCCSLKTKGLSIIQESKNKQTFLKNWAKQAKFSQFERIRGPKYQIFRTSVTSTHPIFRTHASAQCTGSTRANHARSSHSPLHSLHWNNQLSVWAPPLCTHHLQSELASQPIQKKRHDVLTSFFSLSLSKPKKVFLFSNLMIKRSENHQKDFKKSLNCSKLIDIKMS